MKILPMMKMYVSLKSPLTFLSILRHKINNFIKGGDIIDEMISWTVPFFCFLFCCPLKTRERDDEVEIREMRLVTRRKRETILSLGVARLRPKNQYTLHSFVHSCPGVQLVYHSPSNSTLLFIDLPNSSMRKKEKP